MFPKISKIIFVFIFLAFGLGFVFLIPPFQKADEIVHFRNVMTIKHGYGWMVDKRINDFAEQLKSEEIAHQYDIKYSAKTFYKDKNTESVISTYYVNPKSYIAYFPLYLGALVSNVTDYPAVILYVVRFVGFIWFAICLIISLKVIPKRYIGILFAYALLPMTLHQVTEVSYDVMLFSMPLLIFSSALRIIEEKVVDKRRLVLLIVSTILFVLTKPGYYAIVALILIILWLKTRKILLSKPWILAGVGVFGVMVLNIFVFKMIGFTHFKGDDQRLSNGSYQMEILKNHPMYFVEVLDKTLEAKREFYLQSLLGYFGWLDYKYDLYGYLLVLGIIGYFVVKSFQEIKESKLDWFSIVFLGGMIFGTYALIEFMFWLYWTPVASAVIEGVQGRYLLPLFPFALWFVIEIYRKIGSEKMKLIVPLLLFLLIGRETYKQIYYRYYDFSANFGNTKELVESIENSSKEELPLEKVSSRDGMERFFDTSDSDVIGGFQFAFDRGDGVIKVPYQYKLTDEEGKRVYRKGYLNVEKLKIAGIYEEKIDAFKSNGKPVKLIIEPLVKDDKENYFDYLELYNEIQAKLLFITKEQK